MAGLRLSEIWIYPIKSMGGIRMKCAKVMPKGLQYDRRWMLIDSEGVFMTQRAHPRMALFKLSYVEGRFTINFGNDFIQLPIDPPVASAAILARIWNDEVEVFEVLGDYSQWFSQLLGVSCRLVHFPEAGTRLVDEKYRLYNDHVSLADGYPFLIIGQCSLYDLNSRLKNHVPMNRFRPNFVFIGGNPYEEDHWGIFRIGENRFAGVKPCGRCVITTVDQETAVKGIEPLATLTAFRNVNNKINLGQNLIALDCHDIYEGDEIQLESEGA